jgi:NAD(P)-dependent dehydrogenase (short-subunit alcohol dehydrogenase family)
LSREAGNTVIGIARTVAPVQEKLQADNITNVTILQGDMADHRQLTRAAQETEKITQGSGVDYFIVNGVYANTETQGLTPTGYIGHEDLLQKDFTNSVNVNVIGVMFSINAFLPLIRMGRVKKIVVLSTGLADLDNALKSNNPVFVPYSVSKAAVNMVTVKYANDLKREGIIVVALSPGLVNTRETPRKFSFFGSHMSAIS